MELVGRPLVVYRHNMLAHIGSLLTYRDCG